MRDEYNEAVDVAKNKLIDSINRVALKINALDWSSETLSKRAESLRGYASVFEEMRIELEGVETDTLDED